MNTSGKYAGSGVWISVTVVSSPRPPPSPSPKKICIHMGVTAPVRVLDLVSSYPSGPKLSPARSRHHEVDEEKTKQKQNKKAPTRPRVPVNHFSQSTAFRALNRKARGTQGKENGLASRATTRREQCWAHRYCGSNNTTCTVLGTPLLMAATTRRVQCWAHRYRWQQQHDVYSAGHFFTDGSNNTTCTVLGTPLQMAATTRRIQCWAHRY